MVPLLQRKKIWWQGILPLRTHTPLNEGREPLFRGEKPRAPKPGEDPNRKQTEQGSPKETERPQVGSPRAKPQTRNKNNGEARFRVSEGNNPNQRKNDLDLVDERGREGKEAEEEQAIPNRANRKYKK